MKHSIMARRATVAALGLVAATGFLATTSIAQPPAGGGGGFGGGAGGGRRGGGQRGGFGAATLANTPVSALAIGLKLTDDQKTKIEAAQKPVMDIQKSMMPQPGQQMDRDVMRANYQKMQAAQTQADTDIDAILTADQKAAAPAFLKKLTSLRAAGIQPGVYADLKLTDTQETQIADVSEKSQRKMREAMEAAQASGEQPDRTAMMAMYTDARTKVEAVLTPAQKTTLDDYNKAHPQRGFGGGGGGGRRGGGGGGNAPVGGGGNL